MRCFGVEGRAGTYHCKVAVLAGTVAVAGASNQTNNSFVNGGLALQVGGGEVAFQVYSQAWAEVQRVGPF